MGGGLGSIMMDVLVNLNPFNQGLRDAENTARQSASTIEKNLSDGPTRGFGVATSAATKFGDTLRNIGQIAFGVAIGNQITTITDKLLEVGKSALSVGISFDAMKEQAQLAFGTILKNGDAGRQMMADLWSFAAKSPFQFQPLEQAAQKLLAMGVAAKDIIPDLTNMGNAVSALGGGAELLGRVTLAFGQINAAGKATAQDFRQLTEAGIPAWQYLATTLHTDVAGAMQAVSKRSVDAETAIRALNEGMARDFGGMMEVQSRTFNGLVTTMKDNWLSFMGTAMGPAFDDLKAGLTWLVDTMSSPAFQGFGQRIANGFATIQAIVLPAILAIKNGVVDLFDMLTGNTAQAMTKQVDNWQLFRGVLLLASDSIQTFIQAIRGDWGGEADTNINVIVRGFGIVGETIRTLAQEAPGFLANMWAGLTNGATEALNGLAGIWNGTLRPIVDNALVWGQNIVVQFANGIVAGVGVVVDALNYIGSVVTEWLQPHSPPKILPELDKWGTDAANVYMRGWTHADFSVFNDLSSEMEKYVRSLGSVDKYPEDGIIPTILLGRNDLAAITDMIRTTGSVTTEWIDKLVADAGPAGDGLRSMVETYVQMGTAQRTVDDAQKALNDTTDRAADAQRALNAINREYADQIAPLKEKLDDLTQAQQKLNEAQRSNKLQDQLGDLSDPAVQRLNAINAAEQKLADDAQRRTDQRILDGSAYTDQIAGYQQTIGNSKATPEARAKATRDLAELEKKIAEDQAKARLDLEKIGLTEQRRAIDEQRKARDADLQRQITQIDLQKSAAQQQINAIQDQQQAATKAARDQLDALNRQKAAQQDTLAAAQQTLTVAKDRYQSQKDLIAAQEQSNSLVVEQTKLLQQQANAAATAAKALASANGAAGGVGAGTGISTTRTAHNADGTTSTISTSATGKVTEHTNLTPAVPKVAAVNTHNSTSQSVVNPDGSTTTTSTSGTGIVSTHTTEPKIKPTKPGSTSSGSSGQGSKDYPGMPAPEAFVPNLTMPQGMSDALKGWSDGFATLKVRVEEAKKSLTDGWAAVSGLWAGGASSLSPLNTALGETKTIVGGLIDMLTNPRTTGGRNTGAGVGAGVGGLIGGLLFGPAGAVGGAAIGGAIGGVAGSGGARAQAGDGSEHGIGAEKPAVKAPSFGDAFSTQTKDQLNKWLADVENWLADIGLPAITKAVGNLTGTLSSWIKSDQVHDAIVQLFELIAASISGEGNNKLSAAFHTLLITTNNGMGDIVSATDSQSTRLGADLHNYFADEIARNGGFQPTLVILKKQLDDWTYTSGESWQHGLGDMAGKVNEWSVTSDTALRDGLGKMGAQFHGWFDTVGPSWLHNWDDLGRQVRQWSIDAQAEIKKFWDNSQKQSEDSGATSRASWADYWREQRQRIIEWDDSATAATKTALGHLASELGTHTQTSLKTWGDYWTNMTGGIAAWSAPATTAIGGALKSLGGALSSWNTTTNAAWLAAWKNLGAGIKNGLVDGINGAITLMNNFSQKIADVMNGIAKMLHVEGKFAPALTPLLAAGADSGGNGGGAVQGGAVGKNAQGTKDWRGGLSVVGEEGPELVYMPQHSVVIPNGMTEKLLATGIPGFADGLNLPVLSGIMDLIGPKKDELLKTAMAALGKADLGPLTDLGPAILDQVKTWIVAQLNTFLKVSLPVGADGAPIGPENVQRMYAAASSQMGLPYIWGGGHGGAGSGPGIGFDCSGFVAWVLDQGGISNPHGIVTSFYDWMTKGHGKTNVVDIGVDNPYADPNVQHVGISLLGDTFEFGGAKDNGNKNGTRFGEWGQPPGFAGLDKAKGNASNVDASWRNFLSGKAGQFSAGHMPPMSSLFDFISRNPGIITPDMMGKIAAILPTNGARALANGGILNEEVRGIGMTSGKLYQLGERGAEMVLPVNPGNGTGDALSLSNVAQQIAEGVVKGSHVAGRTLADGTDRGGARAPEPTLGINLPAPPKIVNPASETPRGATPDPSPASAAIAKGLGGLGMIGHFPEPVTDFPGHPGWFYGLRRGNTYDGAGNQIDPATGKIVAPGQQAAVPSSTVTNTIAAGSAPTTVNGGGGGAGTAGATPPAAGTAGGVQLVQINITDTIQMPDGKTIVRTITSDPVAVTDLGSAVFRDAAQHQPSPTGRTPS